MCQNERNLREPQNSGLLTPDSSSRDHIDKNLIRDRTKNKEEEYNSRTFGEVD